MLFTCTGAVGASLWCALAKQPLVAPAKPGRGEGADAKERVPSRHQCPARPPGCAQAASEGLELSGQIHETFQELQT